MIILNRLYSSKDKDDDKYAVAKLGASGALIGGLEAGGNAYKKAGEKIINATEANYEKYAKIQRNIGKAVQEGRITTHEQLNGVKHVADKILEHDTAVTGKAAKKMEKIVRNRAIKGALIGGTVATGVGLGLSQAKKRNKKKTDK